MKKCFKCNELKSMDSFYRHPKMSDGRVNKCKECNKKDVKDNRSAKVDYYREYCRERYQSEKKVRERIISFTKKWRKENPKKYAAHIAVGNARRDGRITLAPCEVCGSTEKIHAHHDDYSIPLIVRWLCPAHHKEWHDKNGEGLNG